MAQRRTPVHSGGLTSDVIRRVRSALESAGKAGPTRSRTLLPVLRSELRDQIVALDDAGFSRTEIAEVIAGVDGVNVKPSTIRAHLRVVLKDPVSGERPDRQRRDSSPAADAVASDSSDRRGLAERSLRDVSAIGNLVPGDSA